MRDYAGVPTAELVALYEKHIDVDIVTFASRIDMDERDLKKIVITQNYAFTGWTVAEKIIEGLGLDSASLLNDGDLHEVPARQSKIAALKIAENEAWVKELDPAETIAYTTRRVPELLALRETLVVKTPEQEERLRRDSERAQARQARLKESAAA